MKRETMHSVIIRLTQQIITADETRKIRNLLNERSWERASNQIDAQILIFEKRINKLKSVQREIKRIKN